MPDIKFKKLYRDLKNSVATAPHIKQSYDYSLRQKKKKFFEFKTKKHKETSEIPNKEAHFYHKNNNTH